MNMEQFDYSIIASIISEDITCKDDELSTCSIRLLSYAPIELAMSIIKQTEKELFKILENSEFHYERIMLLSDILTKGYIFHFFHNEVTDTIELVIDFYCKIADLILNTNWDISRNCIEVFIKLYG